MREGVGQTMSYATKEPRGKRLVAGEIVSHAIGEGAKGHYASGFHPPATRLPDKNGAGWSIATASKGRESAMV